MTATLIGPSTEGNWRVLFQARSEGEAATMIGAFRDAGMTAIPYRPNQRTIVDIVFGRGYLGTVARVGAMFGARPAARL